MPQAPTLYGIRAMKLTEEIRRRVLVRMQQTGVIQADLARASKMAPYAVSKAMKGEQRLYLDQAAGWARALDVPLEYLADEAFSLADTPRLSADQDFLLRAAEKLGMERAIRRVLADRPQPERPDLDPRLTGEIPSVQEAGGGHVEPKRRRHG